MGTHQGISDNGSNVESTHLWAQQQQNQQQQQQPQQYQTTVEQQTDSCIIQGYGIHTRLLVGEGLNSVQYTQQYKCNITYVTGFSAGKDSGQSSLFQYMIVSGG